jgi:hypothetical protein
MDWCHIQANSERGKPEPDQLAVDRWIALADECQVEWEALDLDDRDAVDAAIARYRPIVRDFFPGPSGPGWRAERQRGLVIRMTATDR